mgnify:CR=1 FL=1
MSPFFIFAIVLTVAYLIYYTVVILHDLYGKKGEKKSEEETFEIDTSEDAEESVEVSESEMGFSVGGNDYEVGIDEPLPVPSAGRQEGTQDKKSPGGKVLEKIKAKVEPKLEEFNSEMPNPYYNRQLYKLMMSGGRMDGHPAIEAIPVRNEI